MTVTLLSHSVNCHINTMRNGSKKAGQLLRFKTPCYIDFANDILYVRINEYKYSVIAPEGKQE